MTCNNIRVSITLLAIRIMHKTSLLTLKNFIAVAACVYTA